MLRQAVFLVGGLGTRLGDLTRSTPKPLIEVGGRPFIDYLIDEAARHGFTDIVLLAGYLGEQFISRYDGLERLGARVAVVTESSPLGTGGAVRGALNRLDEQFLLANGDTFFDINLRAVTVPPRGAATMALCAGIEGSRYGRVRLEGDLVRSFSAPTEGQHGPINAGVYILSREVVSGRPAARSSIEQDWFPELASSGRLLGCVFQGYFVDMGVPEDLGRARRELPGRTCRPAVFLDRDGVLNVDHGYVHRPADFEWIAGAQDAIRLCNDRGYFVFVVSNQAGVAHGLYDEQDVLSLHGWIGDALAAHGAHIDAFEYCPHHPEGRVEAYRRSCDRRKPGPRMLRDLLQRWPVDASRSLMIGDKDIDMAAAEAAGIRGHLFKGGNLLEFVEARLPAL